MKEIYIKKDELNEIVAKYFKGDLISIEDLISTIEDLSYEIDSLKEEIEDIEQDRDDNYKPRSYYSLYGVSESDFY